jgi:hypothetical protein
MCPIYLMERNTLDCQSIHPTLLLGFKAHMDILTSTHDACRIGSGGAKHADNFFGLLFSIEEYKVYGYVTCTGVRLTLILDDADPKVRISFGDSMISHMRVEARNSSTIECVSVGSLPQHGTILCTKEDA